MRATSTLAILLLVMPAFAAIQRHPTSSYECERGGALCLMTPVDKAEALPEKRSPKKYEAPSPVNAQLLAPTELKGGAALIDEGDSTSTAFDETSPVSSTALKPEPEALEQAQRVINQLHSIEVFLKSVPETETKL